MCTSFASRYKNIFRVKKGAIIGVEAPTGSGKTTGSMKIMSRCPEFFGNTLFIFPTKIAVDAIRLRYIHSHHIQMVTPKTAIRMLITWSHSYDTIVMDEAHFPSREYFAIYRIIVRLRLHQQFRLILLSATIDRQEVRKHFGQDIKFYKLDTKPNYAIKIHYRNDFVSFGPSFYAVSDEIIKTMKEYITSSTKGLCFLATHEQCDKMKRQTSKMDDYKNFGIFSLHGGLTVEEMEEVKTNIQKSSNFICFATNIAETAITIPGINLILDTGLRCMMDGNNIVHQFCDQASMIQRAGRTGRTCDGTVVRLMQENDFMDLPFQEYPVHNFDHIVLQLFNLKVDPVDYLEEHANQSIKYFKSLNLEVPPPTRLATFLEHCGLPIRNGLILDNFMNIYKHTEPSILHICILMCLSIINHYGRKPAQIIYYKEGGSSRSIIIRKIKRQFVHRTDLLMTVLNITLSLFLSEDPKALSAEFSLNFKTFREILGQFKSVLKIAFPFCKDWRTIAMCLMKKDRVCFPSQMVENIRRFFWRQSTLEPEYGLNIMRSEEDMLQVDNTIVDYVSSGHYERISSRVIIPFVKKQFGYVSLWTLPPYDYRSDINKLHYNLYEVERLQNIKIYFKKEYGRSMEEIMYDVAYRPGFYKAEEQLDDFISNFF